METTAYKVEIFIAGSLADIRPVCQMYVNRGLCVTVTKTQYIYKGGRANGAIVGLINYAKYPSDNSEIWLHAMALAHLLLANTGQSDCTIQDNEKSVLLTIKDL